MEDFLRLESLVGEGDTIVLVGLNKKTIGMPKNALKIEKTESTEELRKIYSVADFYFNPSKEETMGMTTVEAIACGTIPVVYNLTALPEIARILGGAVDKTNSPEGLISEVDNIKLPEIRMDALALFDKKTVFERYMRQYF